jgi:NAD dependent epimerase/dehydratase family enzyme
MPWIHLDDLVSIFHQALFNPKLSGLYNAVAPDHVTNREFSEKLAESLSKPFFMPSVPEFMLHLIFGEMANILLKGSRISDQKLLNSNFVFQYPTLSEALKSFSLS